MCLAHRNNHVCTEQHRQKTRTRSNRAQTNANAVRSNARKLEDQRSSKFIGLNRSSKKQLSPNERLLWIASMAQMEDKNRAPQELLSSVVIPGPFSWLWSRLIKWDSDILAFHTCTWPTTRAESLSKLLKFTCSHGYRRLLEIQSLSHSEHHAQNMCVNANRSQNNAQNERLKKKTDKTWIWYGPKETNMINESNEKL